MKTIKSIILITAGIFFIQISYGQVSEQKQTVKVNGNCSQCKKKIEKNALAAGATYAEWNVKTKMLNVSYNPAVTNPVKIETAIAGAGYDTQDVKASDSAYSQLDECCQYERKKSIAVKKN